MKKLTFAIIAAALGLVPVLRADDAIITCCQKQAAACAAACAPSCPDTCKKTCVSVVETKTVEKRVYGSRCEEFCVPRCSMRSLLSGGCSKKGCDECNTCASACEDGSCHKCGKVHTRKVLIVKIKKEEKCVPTCVVVDAPTCVPAPCAADCNTTIVECAPAQKREALPNAPKTVEPMKK